MVTFMSLMKEQIAVTPRHTVIQQTEKDWPSLNTPTAKCFTFLWKYKDKQFCCGHNIVTEGVLVTELCRDVGIWVWLIVWVTTNCSFISDTLLLPFIPRNNSCNLRYLFPRQLKDFLEYTENKWIHERQISVRKLQ